MLVHCAGLGSASYVGESEVHFHRCFLVQLTYKQQAKQKAPAKETVKNSQVNRKRREKSFLKFEEKTFNKVLIFKGFKYGKICVTCSTFCYGEMWPCLQMCLKQNFMMVYTKCQKQ